MHPSSGSQFRSQEDRPKNLEKLTRSEPQPGIFELVAGFFELKPGCFRAGSRVFTSQPGIFQAAHPEFELKPEVFSKFYPQPGRVPGPQQPGRVHAAEKNYKISPKCD